MYFDGFFDVVGLGSFILLIRVVEADPDAVVDEREALDGVHFEEVDLHLALPVLLRIITRLRALYQSHFPFGKVLNVP